MESSSGVPEVPLGRGYRQRYALVGGDDADLSAIALLCLVFAWSVDESEPAPAQVGAVITAPRLCAFYPDKWGAAG